MAEGTEEKTWHGAIRHKALVVYEALVVWNIRRVWLEALIRGLIDRLWWKLLEIASWHLIVWILRPWRLIGVAE